MAEQRPLVILNGQVQQLPVGDTVVGAGASATWKEPVSVLNSGSPEILFSSLGDVVMSEAL